MINFMNKIALRVPMLVYFFWAFTFFWLFQEQRYRAYLQPKLWPLLAMGLAISFLLLRFSAPRKGAVPAVHPLETLARGLVLLMPLVFLFASADSTLGLHAMKMKSNNGDMSEAVELSATITEPPADLHIGEEPYQISLLTLFTYPQFFNGKELIIDGSIYRDANYDPGEFIIYRFSIICCMADSRPVKLLVQGDPMMLLNNETYVRIHGKLQIVKIDDKAYPILKATSVEELDSKDMFDQYMFY